MKIGPCCRSYRKNKSGTYFLRHGVYCVLPSGKIVKKTWGNALLPFHLSIPSPLSSFAMKQPPENQIAGLGSAVSYCSDVRGEAPAANTFWCIMTLKIAPGGNCLVIYFSLQWCILRIKQLYGQQVPEQCFGIQKKVAERRSCTFWLN